jgi:S-adenosylmethionine synthetase
MVDHDLLTRVERDGLSHDHEINDSRIMSVNNALRQYYIKKLNSSYYYKELLR